MLTLALIPKCPGCVAAYVLLFTGVGVSMPLAATLRWTVIVLCVVALVLLSAGAVRRVMAR